MMTILGVCSLRLDFEVFSISGPVGSDELFGGECSLDAFFIEGPMSSLVPIICGENSGSHSKNIFIRGCSQTTLTDFRLFIPTLVYSFTYSDL